MKVIMHNLGPIGSYMVLVVVDWALPHALAWTVVHFAFSQLWVITKILGLTKIKWKMLTLMNNYSSKSKRSSSIHKQQPTSRVNQ